MYEVDALKYGERDTTACQSSTASTGTGPPLRPLRRHLGVDTGPGRDGTSRRRRHGAAIATTVSPAEVVERAASRRAMCRSASSDPGIIQPLGGPHAVLGCPALDPEGRGTRLVRAGRGCRLPPLLLNAPSLCEPSGSLNYAKRIKILDGYRQGARHLRPQGGGPDRLPSDRERRDRAWLLLSATSDASTFPTTSRPFNPSRSS